MQMLVRKFMNKRKNKEYEKDVILDANIEELFNLFGHTLILIGIMYITFK